MANFLTKALLSLVMDKKARETLEKAELGKAIEKVQKRKAAADAGSPPAEPPASPQPAKKVSARAALDDAAEAMSSGKDRRTLIKDAMALRRDKMKILDELDPQSRLKLQAMAIKAFMSEPGKKDGGKGN